jgi:hypothetical protein
LILDPNRLRPHWKRARDCSGGYAGVASTSFDYCRSIRKRIGAHAALKKNRIGSKVLGTELRNVGKVPGRVSAKPCKSGRGAFAHFRQQIALVVPLCVNPAAVVYPLGHIPGLKSCIGSSGRPPALPFPVNPAGQQLLSKVLKTFCMSRPPDTALKDSAS